MNRASSILLAFVFVFYGAIDTMAIEEAQYDVAKKIDNFEIRDYAPHIVAETIVPGDLEDAGSKAFKTLFDYISGDNRSRVKVEMTAPVSQQADSEQIEMTAPVAQQPLKGKWAVSFTMPASYSMDTLPVPDDPNVVLRQIPKRRIAALGYSGFWSEKGYLKNKSDLEALIREHGFKIVGDPIWARYNSPFTPWFMRRNEILIPVAANANQGKTKSQ